MLFRSPLPTTHFKSDDTIDQQILNIETSTPALLEQYERAQPKPALHFFDDSWPDKRHSLSLYSNPRFFFEHWRKNMEREARRKRASRTSSVVSGSTLQLQHSPLTHTHACTHTHTHTYSLADTPHVLSLLLIEQTWS